MPPSQLRKVAAESRKKGAQPKSRGRFSCEPESVRAELRKVVAEPIKTRASELAKKSVPSLEKVQP